MVTFKIMKKTINIIEKPRHVMIKGFSCVTNLSEEKMKGCLVDVELWVESELETHIVTP